LFSLFGFLHPIFGFVPTVFLGPWDTSDSLSILPRVAFLSTYKIMQVLSGMVGWRLARCTGFFAPPMIAADPFYPTSKAAPIWLCGLDGDKSIFRVGRALLI